MFEQLEKSLRVMCSYSNYYKFSKLQYDRNRLRAYQNFRLKKLIGYCNENVKYYRESFKQAAIVPDDIKSVDDLDLLPIILRTDIKGRFWDFLPSEIPASRIRRTSGSTGEPVCVLSDHNSRMLNSASILRYRKALGISPYSGEILVPLKSPYEQPEKNSHWTFLQGLHKTHYVNPYTLNSSTIEHFEKLTKRLKNFSIIGITPAIKALAFAIKDSRLPAIRPKAVIPVGQLLTPKTRSLMEEVFAAKVSDLYACSECGDIAWQCPESNEYHINSENVILEVLKDGQPAKPGEIGEVVLTSLTRYAMPMIRYKNGDLARVSKKKCICGRALPTISEIIGRTGDDISLPDGKKIPWNNIKGLMNHPHVRKFQIVQTLQGDLNVNYVSEPQLNNKDELVGYLTQRFSEMIPAEVGLKFNSVKSIKPEKSGKFLIVLSELSR